MLSLRLSSSSDSLEPCPMAVQLGQPPPTSDSVEFSRSTTAYYQSLTRTPQMTIQPTSSTLQAILQSTLNQLQLCLRNPPPPPHHHHPPTSRLDPSKTSSILSDPTSSFTIFLFDRFGPEHRSTSQATPNPTLAYISDPSIFLSLRPVIMIPQPHGDQALIRSFLGDLARSCYWSSLIRPLVFLVLNYQVQHRHSTGQSSANKLLDQLQLTPPTPPFKLAVRLSTPRAPKRFRTARALRCSTLVDTDSAVLHQHQPTSLHLSRSSAYRTCPRSAIFIRPSPQVITKLELQRLSALAQSQMERSPYCAPEDSLDGDQRQQRYYFVNAYRSKRTTSPDDTQQNPLIWRQLEQNGCDDDDDDVGLEPLEDLLDWDSSTRSP